VAQSEFAPRPNRPPRPADLAIGGVERVAMPPPHLRRSSLKPRLPRHPRNPQPRRRPLRQHPPRTSRRRGRRMPRPSSRLPRLPRRVAEAAPEAAPRPETRRKGRGTRKAVNGATDAPGESSPAEAPAPSRPMMEPKRLSASRLPATAARASRRSDPVGPEQWRSVRALSPLALPVVFAGRVARAATASRVIQTSTRRFFSRPVSVELSATGESSPNPWAMAALTP
jgi:hypothetical protein